jgi:uncharacterized protein (DUF1697 family)
MLADTPSGSTCRWSMKQPGSRQEDTMERIAYGYTIATLRTSNGPMLVAVVPDGDDIEAAIKEEEERAGVTFDRDKIRVVEECVLTDAVEDGDEVIYAGNEFGILTDTSGCRYYAAVIRQ